MAVMHWSPNLSIDHEVIDADHKGLIAGLNALGEAIGSKAGYEATIARLDGLIAATRAHFEREEDIMLAADYPDYEPHRRLHQALLDEIDDLRRRYDEGGMELGEETLSFLRTWLTSHILESDKALGGYLEAQE
jgi:hemerythrin-like metal-binding protein